MQNNKIVMIGDHSSGFKFFGPFTLEEAHDWLEDYCLPYEILDLITPSYDVETELVLDQEDE